MGPGTGWIVGKMGKPLESIGFYTLSDYRARTSCATSPMWRCEMILTTRCNFRCTYCRGGQAFSKDCSEDMPFDIAHKTLNLWIDDGLKNVRFSGGEPTLYPKLNTLVKICDSRKVGRIAISTNGSADVGLYDRLLSSGVNDVSISLDACCASDGDAISQVPGSYDHVLDSIGWLSRRTYVTVGVVVTAANIGQVGSIIRLAHGLGVADIRLIPAAQDGARLGAVPCVEQHLLEEHPILAYRLANMLSGRPFRGFLPSDSNRCHLVQDDSVVAGKWHWPCVIYLREGGPCIGKVSAHMRRDRVDWSTGHDTCQDDICRQNCLDVCVDYNNRCGKFKQGTDSHEGVTGAVQ